MNSGREELLKEEKETGRIEAFSDGVFAIAITLLVLDINVPHHIQSLPQRVSGCVLSLPSSLPLPARSAGLRAA